MSPFGVYIIYSGKSVDEIRTWLNSFTTCPEDIGISRIDHDRKESGEYVESNRILIALHSRVYDKLCEKGHNKNKPQGEFRIAKYEIRRKNHPPKDCGYALYVRLPLDEPEAASLPEEKLVEANSYLAACMKTPLGVHSQRSLKTSLLPDQCKAQLNEKLERLVSYRWLTPNDYTVHYPMVTREEKVAKLRGYAIVNFTTKLDRTMCVAIKVLLDQTKWWTSENQPILCRVSWCKRSTLADLQNTQGVSTKGYGFGKSAPKPSAKKSAKPPPIHQKEA